MSRIEKTVEIDDERLAALLAASDDEGSNAQPVVMINLLRYRDRASYPEGFDAEPCSGREAYGRYGAIASKLVGDAGGRVLSMGAVQATIIGPTGEEWHDAILVEYPSRKRFLTMIGLPEYMAVAPHRTAGLEDSRLIATNIRVL
jgi:uncharacterized protein (DUF1330 family)